MNNPASFKAPRKRILRILGMQLGVTLAASMVLLVVVGPMAAISAAVGGAIALIPAALYASRMVMVASADPKDLLRAQYRAEAFKTAATLILFLLTFLLFREALAGWLFLTYVATLLVYWAALLTDK